MEYTEYENCIHCGNATELNFEVTDCLGKVMIIPACSEVCAENFFSYQEQCIYVFDEQGFA